MLAYPSSKHIQRRLATFLGLIQRVIEPAFFRKLCTALFRRLILFLRFLRSRRQNPWEKERSISSSGYTRPRIDGEYESTIDANGESQIIIPLDKVAYSLYPFINEPQEGSGSGSSQTPDTTISVSEESTYTTQPQFVSSPTTDSRRPGHHRILGYSSDTTPSTEQLGSGEMSSQHYTMPVVEPSRFSLSRKLSRRETLISSSTCINDLETRILSPSQIFPVVPENFQRYQKRRKIPEEATKVTIKPFCTDFSDYYDLPGWNTCTHPEGGRYFHNTAKRVFTDVDLYDPVCFTKITEAITIIEDLVSQHDDIQMSAKTDLVLDLNVNDNGDEVVDYYFADHGLRIVVFAHEITSDCIPCWPEVKGINSGIHLRHALETQYWWHCAAYPNCIELSNDLICELRAVVMHFIMDCKTSPEANSVHTPADLQEILSNIDSLKDNIGKPYSGCISFVGRLMFQFSYATFMNFYGLPEARLSRGDSVHGHWTNRRTWFIKSISMFLFSAPDIHLRNMQKMYVDRILCKSVWEESMKKVNNEWREFILYSALLLNVNVAFLAIDSVDANRSPYRSPAQISSYCSISASIGSIMLGLLLVRQNQTKRRETLSDAHEFLQSWIHPSLGLETLAVMFSLPYALLMYGVISFLIAFWFMCLQHSSTATRSVVVTVCGVVLILIVWCIYSSWEEQEPCNAEKVQKTTLTFEEDHAKLKPKAFKFERETESQTETLKRRLRRRPTLSALKTTLKASLNKIGRGASKSTVEVPIDDNEKPSV